MMMGTGSMETMMVSATVTGVSAGATAMNMDMSDGSHGMSMHFTSNFKGIPVLFEPLQATNGAKAFGIFVFLFFLAFTFRGLSFLSSYVEQNIFTDDSEAFHLVEPLLNTTHSSDLESDESNIKEHIHVQTKQSHTHPHQKQQTAVGRFFDVSVTSLYRDFIRFLMAFTSVMIGYALMLAVMSYTILYFFAIVLGLSFSEIFFKRLSYALELKPSQSICETLH